MTIETSTDLIGTLKTAIELLGDLNEPYKSAFAAALAMPSPVDNICYGVEALYAAVKTDATMTPSVVASVATSVKQLGYLITFNQWHGKAQRCADMGVAMEAIVAGTAPAQAAGPDLDPQFVTAPTPAPLNSAPAAH